MLTKSPAIEFSKQEVLVNAGCPRAAQFTAWVADPAPPLA